MPPARSMTSVGSSATSRVSASDSFSSSDCEAGVRLTANTGARLGSGAGRAVPLFRDQSREPDGDPVSLATAPTSPARSSPTGRCSAPAQPEEAVDALVGAGGGVVQPVARVHDAGEHLEHRHLPDERVGDGAEHVHERFAAWIRGDPELGARLADRHRRRRPCRAPPTTMRSIVVERQTATVSHIRSSDTVDADAGERPSRRRRARRHPSRLRGRGCARARRRRLLPLQVGLELIVVVRDDLLGHVEVHPVLLGLGLGRHRLVMMTARHRRTRGPAR